MKAYLFRHHDEVIDPFIVFANTRENAEKLAWTHLRATQQSLRTAKDKQLSSYFISMHVECIGLENKETD
jgi:hypothetical protein